MGWIAIYNLGSQPCTKVKYNVNEFYGEYFVFTTTYGDADEASTFSNWFNMANEQARIGGGDILDYPDLDETNGNITMGNDGDVEITWNQPLYFYGYSEDGETIAFGEYNNNDFLVYVEDGATGTTIADNLQRIIQAKADIRTAIINKGVEVGENELIDTYASKIDSISQETGGTTKINVQESGLKFGYSTFTEIPEWADWTGITDMSEMFDSCTSLTSIPLIDFSKVTTMANLFRYCRALTTIPLIDSSKVTTMANLFNGCTSLTSVPALSTSQVTNMNSMYYNCTSLTSVPALDCSSISPLIHNAAAWFGAIILNNLTDVGGFLNLKTKSNSNNGLAKCPNLNYESCINVLNGLYDFVANNETPNSTQGILKVHQNFLDLVGDEISIGVNKGWTITA